MRGPLDRSTCACAAVLLLTISAARMAAQVPAGPPPPPIVPANSEPLREAPSGLTSKQPVFSDLNLMRRNEFAHANAATVSVRVRDGHGNAVVGMTATDFSLNVNGTPRALRLRPQGPAALAAHQPIVLLIFPPNQPTVHLIGVRDAIQYFGSQPESMPWRVGIFDANATFLPFTGDRRELLRNLATVQAAKEPMQFTGYRFLPRGESPWQQKAEAAIANMARSDGPRLIIAMNPLSEGTYGLNEQSPAHPEAPIVRVSPIDLLAASAEVGAHIYIDNAGGPETLIPGGGAADPGSLWGTIPSLNNRISPTQTTALNNFAYTNSLMMQTASDTMGGYANGLKDLGAQMERDLRQAYVLEFDMTARDQDQGTPEVVVSSPLRQMRLAMMDVAPLRVIPAPPTSSLNRSAGSAVLEAMRTMTTPVVSPDFRIFQRVDYFPVRGGAAPVLPMTGIVEWAGAGARPEQIAIAESVLDLDLGTPALQREIDADWQARSVGWERDGELHPGHYAWLVAVHDASGKILASSRERFTVAYQGGAAIAVSTLVTGSACRNVPDASGLQRRQPPGSDANTVTVLVDPLRLRDCRMVPEAAGRYTAGQTLRALMRIYPAGKLAKRPVESWTASYLLRGKSGAVEMRQDAGFAIDSGSGLVAAMEKILSAPEIQPGEHTLEVEVRGPGIRQLLKEQQKVFISAGEKAVGAASSIETP